MLPFPVVLRRAVLSFLVLGAAACGGDADPAGATLSRETFVEVMVDLRMAALQQEDATLTPADRDEVLRAHEVTEEDLVTFAEVHGQDPSWMAEVWRDIEGRLNVPIDSTGAEADGTPPPDSAGATGL